LGRLRRGTAIGVAIVVAAAILVASGSASGDEPITFKGHGVKTLRGFHVNRPSTLSWTNTGTYFQISSWGDYGYDVAVTSNEQQGTTYAAPAPCKYGDIRVRAIGAWTITIRPGIEKVGSPMSFSGVGKRGLPPFGLRKGMTMYWTNTGDRFQTVSMTPRRDGVISSGLHHGKVHLRPGHYELVVDAVDPNGPMGSWRMVIR
jgi:hypothetical protein